MLRNMLANFWLLNSGSEHYSYIVCVVAARCHLLGLNGLN